MQIRVLSQSLQSGIDNIEAVKRRSAFVLDRFVDRIRVLRVRIVDDNGPKGGIDQRCEIGVSLTDGRQLRARARAALIPDAIDRALRRLAHAMARAHSRELAQRRKVRMRRQRVQAAGHWQLG